MAKSNAVADLFIGLPGWAWPFVALCLFIPVATLGGAIPVGLGLGGAIGVASMAKNADRSMRVRVVLTIGVTVLTWVGLGATMWFLHRPR